MPGVLGLCKVFMVQILFDLLLDWRGTGCPSDRHCYVAWIRTDDDLPNVQETANSYFTTSECVQV